MSSLPDQQWFEMKEVRRRKLSSAVWIPLRQSETVLSIGESGKVGFQEDTICIGCVAIHKDHREIGETLGWMDVGLSHNPGPYAFNDGRYKPSDVFLYNDQDEIGVELILVQSLNDDHQQRWLVNQDLVLALGLIEENNVWKSANEGYVDVIRLRKDKDGTDVAIEIKAEFLRDYLAARGLALRVTQYRQRMAILEDATYLDWSNNPKQESDDHQRFEARVFEVDTDGALFGGSVAVFEVWRTDVDNEEDVPVFGHETDSNTGFSSRTFERHGKKAYRAEGELWREEWIEPAEISERVRGDQPAEQFFFIVGAGGERLASSALNSEDVGRYLWFRAGVISELLHYRGSALEWYTRDTGSVKCSPNNPVHFGVNRLGMINVYAYDIAKLPHWQQRIWAGQNIAPDGTVSSELLDSQMRARPASTTAPEKQLQVLLHNLDVAFHDRYGCNLFRTHESKEQVSARLHRFRGLDQSGVLELAKDIARITADSIDVGVLRRIVTPPKEESWRSLKHLEMALAALSNPITAHDALTPLVGIYELRLGDAHLPSSKINGAYQLVGIDSDRPPIEQAAQLLDGAVRSLHKILGVVRCKQIGT